MSEPRDRAGRSRRRALVGTLACVATLVLGAAGSLPDESPVADAVMRGDSARVRLLIKQGMDVNAAQSDGMTALHWAASRGDASAAQMLVYAGARLEAVTRNGNYTPLHLAARAGRASAVRALLAAGADVNAVTSSGGATALHFASSYGDAESVTALLDQGAPVDVREGAWAQTALMWAAASNRVAVLDVLIKRGASLEAASKIEDIPAGERALRTELVGRARRVAALKAAETPAVAAATVGAAGAAATPARPAVESGKAAPDKAASGKAAADKASSGKTAAGKAVSGTLAAPGDSAARPVTGFNSRGPSYGELIGNKGGLTALLFAVREGHSESVATLLNAGAQINHVSEGDHTSPLLMATINGRFDMAAMLLARGADVKLASDANATPLYTTINVQWAAKSLYPQPTAQLQQTTTHLALMELMLKAGADPNVRLKKHLWYMSYNFDLLGVNTMGATAFWRAAYGTDVPAMKLLVQYGADTSIPTLKPVGRLPGDDGPGDDATGSKDPSGLAPIPDGGPGVYPLHAASGVGYGEGFAANSHRHAPEGWMPSVKYLIEVLKVDVNQRDHNGYNAIHHAAARGDNGMITYLAGQGVDIMALSRRGQTTVDMANGPVQRIPPFLETVDHLVKMGAKNSNKCKSC